MTAEVLSLTVLYKSGDVPRVDGQLAVARAFGDKSLKMHLSSEPHVEVDMIDDDTEFVILASDGLWKVGSARNLDHFHNIIVQCHGNANGKFNVISGNVKPRSSRFYQAYKGCSFSSKAPY